MAGSKTVVSTPLTYRELLKAIGTADEQEPLHDVRQCVLQSFKAAGGDYNRWNKTDWRLMADVLTKMEDNIELRRASENRSSGLLTLKKVRRRLEVSVDD